MAPTRLLGLALAAALGACSYTPPPTADNATCARLFDTFDSYDALYPGGDRAAFGYDFRRMQISRIRQAGCLTFTRQIPDLETLAPTAPPAGSGPTLQPPVAVHAGVVTSDADAARAVAFFSRLGYRSRAVGTQSLGTRVYVEARQAGDVARIVAIATEAGFVGPYPSRFRRF